MGDAVNNNLKRAMSPSPSALRWAARPSVSKDAPRQTRSLVLILFTVNNVPGCKSSMYRRHVANLIIQVAELGDFTSRDNNEILYR